MWGASLSSLDQEWCFHSFQYLGKVSVKRDSSGGLKIMLLKTRFNDSAQLFHSFLKSGNFSGLPPNHNPPLFGGESEIKRGRNPDPIAHLRGQMRGGCGTFPVDHDLNNWVRPKRFAETSKIQSCTSKTSIWRWFRALQEPEQQNQPKTKSIFSLWSQRFPPVLLSEVKGNRKGEGFDTHFLPLGFIFTIL